MMKRTLTIVSLSILAATLAYSQFHVGAKYTPKLTTTNPDSAFFDDIGIRGSWIASDIDNDGKPEIIVTDYTKRGRVHVFQSVGNDTLEWVWSSPFLDSLGSVGSEVCPRTIRDGDLDGDGIGEIIFPMNGYGYFVFEWDGVTGSHNFGTKPSALIPNDVTYGANFGPKAGLPHEGKNISRRIEHFEIADVDNDGIQELLTPVNTSIARDFLIISADGQWDFENQGFASFKIEGSTNVLANTHFGGGTPYSIVPADLDGDGKKELVLHNWNYGDYYVMKVTGPDTYVLADTTGSQNGNQYFRQTGSEDNVALFGITAGDLDEDGNDEVYFPFYGGTLHPGHVFVVDYKPGDDVLKADTTHSADIGIASMNSSGAAISSFMAITADFNANGKSEVIVGSAYPSNVVALEYTSGPINDPASYQRIVYYEGESSMYSGLTIRDSAGVVDTVLSGGDGFVSKMAGPVDIDGDGKIELLLPYQSLADSITVTWSTYNVDSARFVSDSSTKVTNPQKWIFRTLERDVAGSVFSRDRVVITPDDYVLQQNYPNPFNPTTNISFVLPLNKKVTAKIYDMLGKEVRTLINNEDYAKGSHTVVWNGQDQKGRQVASGAYIFKMIAGNVEKTMKMMLLK